MTEGERRKPGLHWSQRLAITCGNHPYEDAAICPTCKGDGRVNPLTAPKGFLCLSATDCPDCEGKGYVE